MNWRRIKRTIKPLLKAFRWRLVVFVGERVGKLSR